MRKLLTEGKKKVAVIALSGAVVMGSIGGSAYAYKDEWTPAIQRGVSMLAGYIFKSDIETAIKAHGDTLEGALRKEIQSMIASTNKKLQDFKNAEIDRGKKSLDDKYTADKNQAQTVLNEAVEAEKNKQKAKNDAAINESAAEMDAIIESELDKIPN